MLVSRSMAFELDSHRLTQLRLEVRERTSDSVPGRGQRVSGPRITSTSALPATMSRGRRSRRARTASLPPGLSLLPGTG